jgi:hypothetical protein
MIPKRVMVPDRVRRPPPTGWSWVDRRFVREHLAYLSREATSLYFILCAVADKHGMSFYGDGTLAVMVRVPLSALVAARDELLARDLIAHEVRFTQALSLLPPCARRGSQPGAGLMELGDILRRAIASTPPDRERGLP